MMWMEMLYLIFKFQSCLKNAFNKAFKIWDISVSAEYGPRSACFCTLNLKEVLKENVKNPKVNHRQKPCC